MGVLYAPPTQNGLQKTLDAKLDVGVTSAITLNNTTGVQNKPGVCVIDRIDTNSNLKSSTVREFVVFQGTSGATLVTLTRGIGGSTDQDHAVGAVVEFIPDITWGQAIYDALANLVSVSTGALDTTKVVDLTTAQTLTNKNLTAPTITGTVAGTPTITTPTLSKPVINGTNPTGATYTPATGAQTVALDCAANNLHIVTGHASGTAITFTVANATNNQPFIVSILQGATTVSTITGWFATVRWAGGTAPTLTATLNKRDVYGFMRTGIDTYDGFIIGQNL